MANYTYVGAGKLYLGDYKSNQLIQVGNCTALSFSFSEDVKELPDFTKGGGGTYAEVRRISAVEVSATLSDYSPVNLARAVYGSTEHEASKKITGETLEIDAKDRMFPMKNPVDISADVVVKAGTTVWVKGTDYEVEVGGITILTGSTKKIGTEASGSGQSAVAASPSTTLTVDYSHVSFDSVQVLTESGKEYRLYFDGVNDAREGKAMIIDAYRVKLGALASFDVIGDDFASMEISGKVLRDERKTSKTESAYFNVKIAA